MLPGQEQIRSGVCALVNARRLASRSSSESGAEARGCPPAAWRAKRAQAAGLALLPSTTRAVAASARPAAEQGTPGGAREASGSEEAASQAPRVPARAPTCALSTLRAPSPARVRQGGPKSTAVVFAPLTTMPTRSPGDGA